MNVQTLPRSDIVVKSAFVPKLDYLVFADYDQIELRILAYYLSRIGDDSMREVFLDSSRDLHSETAKSAFSLDREPTPQERHFGKSLNFSMCYGGGIQAVMRYLKEFDAENGTDLASYGQAKQVLQRFHNRWPGINALIDGLREVYNRRGYLVTINGARLHPPTEKVMLNSLVQSSAAEMMRKALRVSYRKLFSLRSHIVCTVHDEIVFDCCDCEMELLLNEIPRWMSCFPEVEKVIPIVVSMQYSDTNWAEKKPIGGYNGA